MPVTPITDLGTAVVTGLAAAFAAFMLALPSVIGAILLLVIGWIIAGIVGSIVARFLRVVRVNELAQRSGITGFMQRAKLQADPAAVIGGLVKWYVRLVFVLLAASAVGLTAVSGVVEQILAFIPNLLVALLFLGAFSWLASLAKDLVIGAAESARIPNANALGTLTFATVLAFGIVAAANQIGVAATLINTLFMGVVGALALAFGLAFGLGGREQASSMLAEWRGRAAQAMEESREPSARPAFNSNDRRDREAPVRSS
ncbi:MAG: small-conductance mechanosensitive ion channel [Chloroflexota bacterium]